MAEISSTIAPGPKVLRTYGDVPLPIVWGDHHESLEKGGFLEVTGSDGNALTAVNGHIIVRAGSVLVKNSTDKWRLLNTVTDTTPADGVADEIADADAVGILKSTVDLVDGGGLVGIYIAGGFIAARMPSIADNAAMGLEASVMAGLTARGFKFAENY